jgi:hypothetical protein
MNTHYRISQLDATDVAYPGARWALMAPVWQGQSVKVMAVKTATLSQAVNAAESDTWLGCDIEAVTLMEAPPHGDPLTIEHAREWIAYVNERAAAGNKRAMADREII